MADILSRQLSGMVTNSSANIAPELLEDLSSIDLPQQLTITPSCLRYIMLSSLPESFTSFPRHKKQVALSLPYYDLQEDLLKVKPEMEVAKIIFGNGYTDVTKDTVAFVNKNNRKMNKVEYDKLVKESGLDQLRAKMMFLQEHRIHFKQISSYFSISTNIGYKRSKK